MHFKVKRVGCIKGGQYLFRNLSFSLAPGQLAWVQGPNGSGKSSLLKILAGLAIPERGNVENIGEIAYVGHKEGIKKGLSVMENIVLHLTLTKQHSQPELMNSILSAFDLQRVKNTLCSALSMGQRRKVALATLILKQKPIWILDEPFTGLDKASIDLLCGCFTSHLSKQGMIIVASHAAAGMKPHQTIELVPC